MTDRLSRMFSEVASTYDRTNHLLTLGLDIAWRRRAARMAAAQGGALWLDVCCGPGEMTRNLARLAPAGTRVTAVDYTPAMMTATRRPIGRDKVQFVLAEAGHLPFASAAFDLVAVSFATRNLNASREVLLERFREFRRVLKPGGMFLNLDTSQPSSSAIRALFHLYVRALVRPLGAWISKSKKAYAYLSETISGFYEAQELSEMIRDAGFKTVGVRPLFFGAAAIHRAWKAGD